MATTCLTSNVKVNLIGEKSSILYLPHSNYSVRLAEYYFLTASVLGPKKAKKMILFLLQTFDVENVTLRKMSRIKQC